MVDVRSHAFAYPSHFTEDARDQTVRAHGTEINLTAKLDEHRAKADTTDKTVVFGIKLGLMYPNSPPRFTFSQPRRVK